MMIFFKLDLEYSSQTKVDPAIAQENFAVGLKVWFPD